MILRRVFLSNKGGFLRMRMKKILCLALAAVMISAGIASALSLGDIIPATKSLLPVPENALTPRPDDSVYLVLKLDDTSAFLRWLVSEENINLFMPLILGSEDSNDIIGGLELMRAFTQNTPLKSAALIFGMNKPESKNNVPFFQMVFTVDSSVSSIVKKISEGSAEEADFAKLIFGLENPLNAMAVTMLKAEKLNGNAYRIDNELFVKAQDDLIVIGTSKEELEASLKALEDPEARLFSKITRKFSDKDFALIHVDYATLDKLDDDNSLKDADDIATKFFDKPLNAEFAFNSQPDKFTLSFAVNVIEAMRKEFAEKVAASIEGIKPVKGSYLKPAGEKTPLLAASGQMNLSAIKDNDDTKKIWDQIVRQMKARFGITEDEVASFFNGPFSFTVNDSVTFEGMKIPAIYFSQTGKDGTAAKIFEKLSKSPHFKKIQDGILQLDSSVSPVSCLIKDGSEALGISFAELTNLSASPDMKPSLKSLVEADGVFASWIDFEAIRNWITDSENGVLAMAMPMAKMTGYGEIADAVQDVLTAELSVPSIAVRAVDHETFIFEFANVKINPENGLAAKLVKIYKKFSN